MSDAITDEDAQAWVEALDDRGQTILRVLMETCIRQGRAQAMDEMLDAALAVQRSTDASTPHREIATKLVGSIWRGRMAERLGIDDTKGSA